jgi:hypothetical protein
MYMVHEKEKMDYGSSRMSWGGILCIKLMQHGIPHESRPHAGAEMEAMAELEWSIGHSQEANKVALANWGAHRQVQLEGSGQGPRYDHSRRK